MDRNIVKAHEDALEKHDIDNFVSFTAISVSAGRLAEGMRDDPLYKDPLTIDMLQSSEAIQAAAKDFREMVLKQEKANSDPHVTNMVVQRTHYLDDKLMQALAAMQVSDASTGIERQVVVLGSGLDTKAWRLRFPAGTAVFEVDQKDMSGFKRRRLAASGAQTDASADASSFKYPLTAASWASVATDLMHPSWVDDLEAQGFKKGLPTGFVAEGLLYYLSPEAVKSVLSTAADISGPSSALLFSCINEPFYRASKHDLKREGLSETVRRFNEVFQFGMPDDVAGFLKPLGWDASADGAVKDCKDVYQEYGVQEWRPADGVPFDQFKEENNKLFGEKKYYLVNAQRST